MVKHRVRKTTTRKKSKAKQVKLNPENWIRNSKEIAELREILGNTCEVVKGETSSPVIDHSHEDGSVRGVLDFKVNILEGRFLKLFTKMQIERDFGIDFPTFLVNMGTYLQQEPKDTRLHYKYMDDFRNKVSRWKKDELLLRLQKDYGIVVDSKVLVKDLVQMYVQEWVYEKEK